MKLHASCLMAGVLCSTAATAESAASMQSVAEAAHSVPAGPWQGNWRVLREDTRIRTRGGGEALRLQVIHDAGSDHAQVQWVAGPAICEDPLAEPCEWIGASGESLHAPVTDESLYLLLPLSADSLDPLLLHIPSGPDSAGLLLSLNSGLRYRVRLSPESEPTFPVQSPRP